MVIKVFLALYILMTNTEIITEIKKNFERVADHKNINVKSEINSVVRQIGLLKVQDKSANLRLLQIIADLKSAEENETRVFKLSNPEAGTIEYSDSFFNSVNILKEELFEILNKL